MTPPCLLSRDARRRQRGVSVIAAIFLLLLFALIAALMATLLSTANMTSAEDVEGMRAFQAAQAGVEWGLAQPALDPNGDAAALPSCFPNNPAQVNAIPGFVVSVSCTPYPGPASSYSEGGQTLRVFQIVATATAVGAAPVGSERQVSVRVDKCRDATISSAPYDC